MYYPPIPLHSVCLVPISLFLLIPSLEMGIRFKIKKKTKEFLWTRKISAVVVAVGTDIDDYLGNL